MYCTITKSLLTASLVAIGSVVLAQNALPKFSSDAEKDAWVKANPSVYAQIVQQSNSLPIVSKPGGDSGDVRLHLPKPAGDIATPQATETKAVKLLNVPGYPTYVFTGDKVADDARYQAAKDAWIAANPQAYQALFQSQPVNAAQIRSQEAANGYKTQTTR